MTMFWFAQYVYVPYQTPYLLMNQVAFSATGIIMGAYGFSQLVLRMPIGVMADKNGNHKLFIIIGVAASALASVFRLTMPPETGFFWGNILSGLASAMWLSFMLLYSEFFRKEHMQKAMGLMMTANSIGIFMGFMLSTILYGAYGMNLLCYLSVIAGGTAMFLSFFLKSADSHNKTVSVKNLLTVYWNKRLIFFGLLVFIQQGILMSTCMSFTMQIAQQNGASSIQIGMLSLVYILSAIFFSYFASSKLAQKQSPMFWLLTTMLLMAVYCFSVPHLKTDLIIIFQILMGMSTGILVSFCTFEAIKEIPQGKRSTAMGYFQAIFAAGMTILPALAGKIAENYGVQFSFYAEGIIAVAGAVLTVYYYRLPKKTIV
ncbi:MFS transporter [Pectinatus haikarae]|uniref:MFS transporter n=1 Tax=Pectinatus haikarae TaxID=349096 RepID=UPI002ED83941